jgi:hypothetical protein
MICNTPPLSVKTVSVVPALFKAQLPDTLRAIQLTIPEWTAVHVTAAAGAAGRNAVTPDQVREELLGKLRPLAMLHTGIHPLTTPEIPPNTIATFVPDQVKPSFAPEYQNWKFIYYKQARARLFEFFDRALGGIPEGPVGVADALVHGPIKGQVGLEGWTGSVGVPSYRRTMDALVDPQGKVMFWDTAFGFEASGETFLKTSDLILGMFGAKQDRLYFDATGFSWFVVFYPAGQMRVGLL